MAQVQPVDVAATLTALGGITALLVGARATKSSKAEAPAPVLIDPADTPAALRERLAALETDVRRAWDSVGSLEERIALLETLRTSLETLERRVWQAEQRPARRRTTHD